jgi:hypothetical protein
LQNLNSIKVGGTLGGALLVCGEPSVLSEWNACGEWVE